MEPRDAPPLTAPPPPPGDPVAQCLNCGTDLHGAYCHVCGQEGVDRNLSIRRLLQDFLGDFFSFDGRFFRTLRPLFTRPGALTAWYVAGHRAPYVPPMRLYVFASFVLFFAIAIARLEPGAAMVNTGGASADSTGARLMTPEERAAAEAEIDSLRQVLRSALENPAAALDSTQTGRGNVQTGDSASATVMGVDVSNSWLGRFLKARGKRIADDPEGFKEHLARRLPLLLFLLVPVFAAELKLLYLRRSRLYVQHLIFALHFQAFAFLWFVLILLVEQLFEPAEYAFFFLPVYLFLALRRVYGQSWGKTLLKEFALFVLHGFGIAVAFTLYALVLIALF